MTTPRQLLRIARAALGVSRSAIALRILGFERCRSRMERISGGDSQMTSADIHAWASAYASTARLPWGRCLARSMALHRHLRRRGINTNWALGVARGDSAGLRAHAWVELNGRPLGEDSKALEAFQRLQPIGCETEKTA